MDAFRDWALQWSGVFSLLFMFLICFFFWRTLKLMPKTKPQQIKPEVKHSIGWEDIAGVDEAKDELREVVDFLKDPSQYKRFGAKVPKGVLLHGPPGTGKTLLAKAVAHESGAQFFSQSAASFVEMFAGLGAARIRRLFREARKHAPAIIFIDELDAVGGARGSDFSGEREQTLNQLLVEMDGFPSSDRVVVMAASNLLEKLDQALLRPGRFDRQIFVSPPDLGGRREILDVHTRNKPVHEVDLDLVARQTAGLTGAELENIANEAAIHAARRRGVALTQADFEGAIERVVAGVKSRRALSDHEKRIVAYHEAGHALCGELLPSIDPVHKVTIVPTGTSLGYAMYLPEEDRLLKTREDLIDRMTVALGGRCAEELVFGQVTTGAASDLRGVAETTYAMVHDYAMGTAEGTQHTVISPEAAADITRRIRDEEQRELAFEAQRTAEWILKRHRDKLDELAEALIAQETLDRGDLDRLLGDLPHAERHPGAGLRIAAADRSDPAAWAGD
jgi:cell division protease FtsH